MNLEGRLDQFNMSLTSDPALDEVDILALLTLGQLFVLDDVDIAGAGQTSTIIDGNASD